MAIIIGGATGTSLIAGDALSGDTHIPLGVGVAVAVFCCGIVYTLAMKFQGWTDSINELKKDFNKLPCPHHSELFEIIIRRLGRIEGKLGLTPFEKLPKKEQETSTI